MELSPNALNPYHRMLWPNGRSLAFTVSYDDGVEQDIRLIQLMDAYGIKGTFNLNTGLMGKQELLSFYKNVAHNMLPAQRVAEVYRNHEIACHGHMHQALPSLSGVEAARELLYCREGLEHLLGRPVTGYAYAIGPYDEHSEQYLRMCGLTYARTTESTGCFDLPKNFFYWHPTCHHQDPRLFQLAEEFLRPPALPFLKKRLLYVWGHSYEFEAEQNWDRIERLFSCVGRKDSVWYCTNGELVDYSAAYRRLVFSADRSVVYNPNCIDVWMENGEAAVCAAAGKLTEL